jgi:2'-5' RNA ligase
MSHAAEHTVNHFLALRLDDDSRDRLVAVADRLRAWELPARWVHPDDFHLTLVFLGPMDDTAASYLPEAIGEVAGACRRPDLAFVGLGVGGGGHEAPKYLFAAVGDREEGCDGMRRDLCDALGEPPEARYRPHVTLCRPQPAPAHLPLMRDWPHLLEAHGQAHWGACVTTDLVLCRSSGTGATRYETLASWPLLG